MTDDRNLLSFGLSDKHTLQLHAITGTPCEVPVPKNVIFKSFCLIDRHSKIIQSREIFTKT
jgi:hypothetical protein